MRFLDRASFACLPPTIAPLLHIDLVEATSISTVGPQVQGPALCGASCATAAAEPPSPVEGQRGGAERHGYAGLRPATLTIMRRDAWNWLVPAREGVGVAASPGGAVAAPGPLLPQDSCGPHVGPEA